MGSKKKRIADRSFGYQPTRRQFLQFSAAAFSTVALSNCARNSIGQATNQTATSAPATSGEANKLYLYTWADYSNNEVYQRFQEQTGIEVIADVYDSNETMLAKLQAGGGSQYSIVYPSDYTVQQMVADKLLLPLDKARLEGIDSLMERWQNPTYDAQNAHSIPFHWGTTGFVFNTKVLEQKPTDWNFLWENQEKLAGKITLLDDVRETMGAALKSLGYSYNATDPAQIEAAYQKLKELKPTVAAFQSYGWEDQLIAGDLAISMSYSTLGNLLPVENPHLEYVIPENGTSVWTDTIAIPAGAPNIDAAYAWLNFNLNPENAAFAATRLKTATPNKQGFELLSSDMKNNPKLYPTPEMVNKSDGIVPVESVIEIYDRYWTELKSA
jgi:spermidine/putrescine transport system substrate-binding protein